MTTATKRQGKEGRAVEKEPRAAAPKAGSATTAERPRFAARAPQAEWQIERAYLEIARAAEAIELVSELMGIAGEGKTASIHNLGALLGPQALRLRMAMDDLEPFCEDDRYVQALMA